MAPPVGCIGFCLINFHVFFLLLLQHLLLPLDGGYVSILTSFLLAFRVLLQQTLGVSAPTPCLSIYGPPSSPILHRLRAWVLWTLLRFFRVAAVVDHSFPLLIFESFFFSL